MVSDNLWNKCCQRKGVLAMQRAFVDVRIFYPFAQTLFHIPVNGKSEKGEIQFKNHGK